MTDWLKELIWDMRGETVTVDCVRCGQAIQFENAIPEEGGEWECFPCSQRCNEQERIERYPKETGR